MATIGERQHDLVKSINQRHDNGQFKGPLSRVSAYSYTLYLRVDRYYLVSASGLQ
jgi:hypothetical protein